MKYERSQRESIHEALDHAQLALAGNLLEAALEHTRAALELDPDHVEARLLEARIRLRRHEPRLALSALDSRDRTARSDSPDPTKPGPSRPDVTMLRATALAAAGKVDLAATIMESLANEFPDDTGVLRALAGMQIHDGRPRDAAQTLEQVLKIEPTDRAASRLRADLIADRDPAAALEALGQIDGTNRRRAARFARQSQRFAEAESHYAQLLSIFDEEGASQWPMRREAADVAEVMGENQKALDRLSRVSGCEGLTDQEVVESLNRSGRLHLNAGRWGESAKAYRQATRRLPVSAEAWAGLVTVAHMAGRKRLMNRADRTLRGLTTREERRNLLARLYPHAIGAPAPAATGDEKQELKAAADSPLQRMLADASVVMAKSAEKFPHRADVHFHRAMCNAARGETRSAGDSLEIALQINPRYTAAQTLADRLGVGSNENELLPLEDF